MKLFLLSKKKEIKIEKPTLKIFSTVVPKVFEEKFKSWDRNLASKNLVRF